MSSEFTKKYGTDDPRLGDLIKPYSESKKWDVAILGFPHDEGVRRNGGQVGGADCPFQFRSLFQTSGLVYKAAGTGALQNCEQSVDISGLKVCDAGDIEPDLSLEEAHKSLMSKVKELISSGAEPFVVRGGNDQSFPNAMGLIRSGIQGEGGVTVINIDAHLDVRPLSAEALPHSGSPFRQLLENPEFQNARGHLVEFGAQGHQCSAEHWKYVLDSPGGRILSFSHLRNQPASVASQFAQLLQESREVVFVSFDIDAISSADCPGVSSPSTIGFSALDALEICYEAGLSPKVKLVDLSEFNPSVESVRTGKLLAAMFYFFLMGFAKRCSS